MTSLALVHSGYAAFFLGCNKTEQEIFPSLLELRWGIISDWERCEFVPYMIHVNIKVISLLLLQSSTQMKLVWKTKELNCCADTKTKTFQYKFLRIQPLGRAQFLDKCRTTMLADDWTRSPPQIWNVNKLAVVPKVTENQVCYKTIS